MTHVVHVQKSAGIGGSERHLLALLPALAERGLDLTMAVLATRAAEEFIEELENVGIEVWSIPAGPDLNPAAIWQLTAKLRRCHADLVHTHLIHADLHAQLAARMARVPAVSSVHGAHGFYYRQPSRTAASIAGRLALRTIAISDHVGGVLTGAGIVAPDRLRVVHYGIAADRWVSRPTERYEARRELGLTEDEVAVGIAARLIPGKGHDLLVRSVAAARRRGKPLRLLIAGAGPLREEIGALVGSEGLAEAASFLGFVADVRRFMAACDVVAFPTSPQLGEGFGLAALEAMAAGRPIVATRVASLPEVVADGESGLLVEPGSVDALADRLVLLAEDDALRAHLGSGGRERAARCFSLERMVDATLAVYNEALSDARAARHRGLAACK